MKWYGTVLWLVLTALVTLNAVAQTGVADPFAGHHWFAVESSWPGTIQFDGQTRKVLLEPMGSGAIRASYHFTVKSTVNGKGVPEFSGDLVMTANEGQVSKAAYRIVGKRLDLEFAGRVEHYKSMTRDEEKAERLRIKSLLENAKKK